MTTAENPVDLDDPAYQAKALYGDSPRAPEPVAFKSDAEVEARLFYPDGPSPPLRPRRLPADDGPTDTERGPTSDEARQLYGGEPPQEEPAKRVWRGKPVPAETKTDELTEAEADAAVKEFGGEDVQAATDTEPATFDEAAYDGDTIASYRAVSAELGIDKSAAEQLLAKVAPKLAERQQEQLAALQEQWVEQTRSDPELDDHNGIDGNLQLARGIVDRFGGDELREVLNQSGLGSHPAVVRAFVRIGRRLGRS